MATNNKNIDKETWRMIIQIAITVLTLISGMLTEANTGTVASLMHNDNAKIVAMK